MLQHQADQDSQLTALTNRHAVHVSLKFDIFQSINDRIRESQPQISGPYHTDFTIPGPSFRDWGSRSPLGKYTQLLPNRSAAPNFPCYLGKGPADSSLQDILFLKKGPYNRNPNTRLWIPLSWPTEKPNAEERSVALRFLTVCVGSFKGTIQGDSSISWTGESSLCCLGSQDSRFTPNPHYSATPNEPACNKVSDNC